MTDLNENTKNKYFYQKKKCPKIHAKFPLNIS